MNIVLLLFITLSLSKQCNEYTELIELDTVDNAFECIESIKTTEKENTEIIDGLKYYLNAYVFKDILKNPPQPSFSNNYYEKVDIDSELDKINTKTTSLYEFYSEIKNLIISTRDSHLVLTIDYTLKKPNSELVYFVYFLPFKINIDNDKKMYLKPLNELPNTLVVVDVPKEIINNQNVPVKTINGEDPFNIIREFGKNYLGLKCPHAQFTKAKSAITLGSLGEIPLTKEYLNTPITITWENGESRTINYNIIKFNPMNQKFQEALERSKRRGIRDGIRIEDFEEITERKRIKQENDEYEPNCSINKEICCLTTSNKVNTLIVNTFDAISDGYYFSNKLTECLDKFDSNDYPIQVIFPKNGGGKVQLAQTIEKALSPYDDVDYILSSRISEFTEDIMKKGLAAGMYDPETCESRRSYLELIFSDLFPLGEWYTNTRIIKYGDVEHNVTQPSIDELKKTILMKKPRKPTEIVVYTDSYCYSACSLVTKGLKEWGGAILV
ncbi:hypothetical protein ENUP19_0076G0018 [Entamoeba nuttalli]|uniref:Uncharacterized protein n=1 Tax=Entamoeba nuttalli TaxID=412467 RepID=A0ABQ0DEJ0_9EUKA